jgi:hypothetical protein
MTLLKKIGLFVVKIAEAILNINFLPLLHLPAGAAAAVDRLRAAVDAVITADQMFAAAYGPDAKNGGDKLKAATPYVAALLHDVIQELKPDAKPKDEAKFEDACTRATAAIADALNAYEG